MKKFLAGIFSLVTVLFLTFNIASMAHAADAEPTDDVIGVAMGNDDFSILVSALQKAELVETLQGEGPFTVFAPTNAAFEKLLKDLDITAEELLAQPDLAKVLTYHVVPGKVMAADLTDGLTAGTVNGQEVMFDLSGDPMVNDANITATDIAATNGVVHVIDTILVPEDFTLQAVEMEEEEKPTEPTNDIVELALSNDDLSILVSALQKAELVDALKGEGPFTVFAPTNAAFEKLLKELDITPEELLAQPDLAKVLTYHVVPGKVMAADLTDGMTAETLNGESVTFDLSGDPMVNESTITATDVGATNGVIHVIDTVLVPKDFTLQKVDMGMDDVAQTGIESSFILLFGILVTAAGLLYVVFQKKTA